MHSHPDGTVPHRLSHNRAQSQSFHIGFIEIARVLNTPDAFGV